MNEKTQNPDTLGFLDKLPTKRLLLIVAIILVIIAVIYLFFYSDSPLKLGPWRRQFEEYFNLTRNA